MWFRNDLFTLRTQPDLLLCNVYLLCLLIYYENLDIFSKAIETGMILSIMVMKKKNFYVQHSPAPTLPRVTLYSQLRYFELGPQNPELS